MDRSRLKKLIKIGWWSGWSVGECVFWYRLTRVLTSRTKGRKTVVVVDHIRKYVEGIKCVVLYWIFDKRKQWLPKQQNDLSSGVPGFWKQPYPSF